MSRVVMQSTEFTRTFKLGPDAPPEPPKKKKKGFFGKLCDGFDKLMSTSGGGWAEALCDKIGLPDWAGDTIALACDIGSLPRILEHGADLGADIARATGDEELGAWLDASSQKLNSVNDVAQRIGVQVGLTVASGGAGGAVCAGMSAAQIASGVAMTGAALRAGASIEQGDWLGAATNACGALAGLSGCGEALGMSAEACVALGRAAEWGEKACGVAAAITADGKLTWDDLLHLPLEEWSGVDAQDAEAIREGLEFADRAMREGLTEAAIGELTTRFGDEVSGRASAHLASALTVGVGEAFRARVGVDASIGVDFEQALRFGGELVGMELGDPELASIFWANVAVKAQGEVAGATLQFDAPIAL